MSASGSSRSNSESGPSLSEVTTSSCPFSSKNFRRPNAPETQPSSSPGVKSIFDGVGKLLPSG
ncbi:hypothetical protein C1Y40_03674 [Mycobacterium talmoniae]|uniref:Uncharacterized protein n=1 Tax=Mycobacterium talmoniae TaxID=1858794 RepID=A0A2S8BHQ6_9MYCO|nr:hypothetical protein C1Y40_03674 [Mycobacterium talmoniae]